MSPHIRTVKTASGARAVQIVYSKKGGRREMEHVGSAHTDAEYELLVAAARQKIAAGQGELDLGMGTPDSPSLQITGMKMTVLTDAIARVYNDLGIGEAAGGDEVFFHLVLARLVEPTSKLDSLRVVEETGLAPASYATLKRRLPTYAAPGFRLGLAEAFAAQVDLGPKALVLYDVSTLYFEAEEPDGFREPGFSKERRIDPQITIGLLTDGSGFPLMVNAFAGNMAETKTMLPVVEAFKVAHNLDDVTVVADTGMLSYDNRIALQDSGLGYIIGQRLPEVPYVIEKWMADHPGQAPEEGQIFTARTFTGPAGKRKRHYIYYQYRGARARRTLRGIDKQVEKAKNAIERNTPIKRNRFLKVTGEDRALNEEMVQKARDLAGYKAYITNLDPKVAGAEFVIGAYHHLWQVEKSFRMSKHDLAARPIYHHQHESIEAHLTIVFAALAVARRLEALTGWSLKKFITTARRYRTVTINTGNHHLTATEPVPTDLQTALDAIHHQGH